MMTSIFVWTPEVMDVLNSIKRFGIKEKWTYNDLTDTYDFKDQNDITLIHMNGEDVRRKSHNKG